MEFKKNLYGARILAENDILILTSPQNSQDTNYHVYEKNGFREFLVDIGDVFDNEVSEDGGILFGELKELDIDTIEENAWKILN